MNRLVSAVAKTCSDFTFRTRHQRNSLNSKIGLQLQALEPRVLLVGDLVGHWLAADIQADDAAVLESWSDSTAEILGDAIGEPKFAENQIGGRPVVRFDPTDGDDRFQIDNLASPVSGKDDFTVAVMFSTTETSESVDGAWFSHMGIVDSSSKGFSTDWGIALNGNGQIIAGLGGGFGKPSTSVTSTESNLNDGTPHVAIFTRSGSEISLLIDNGQATTRNDASTAARTNSVDLSIGGIQTNGTAFNGDIAEVRFYDGVANADEAAQIHDDIVGYYNNQPPTAADDNYEMAEDPAFFFNVSAAAGVLANDADPEGDAITASLVETTQHGSLSLKPDGSFIYKPEKDFFGTDTFTYTADDFRPGSVANASINVTPVYDPVTPVADSYKLLPGQALSVDAASGLLSNDLNPDRANLQVVLESNVTDGSLTLNADGSFDYNPQQFAGTATFEYRIDDGTNVSSPVTASFLVNTPPTSTDDQFQVDEDLPLVTSLANGLLANDADADGNAFTTILVEAPTHGTLDLADDGSFTYQPDQDYFGEDKFTYRIEDWEDSSEIATARISVRAIDDAPLASSDVYFGAASSPISTAATVGLLANDSDIDSVELQAILDSEPANGTVTLQQNGSFEYTPNANFTGIDTFTYKASDGNSQSSATTVSLYTGTSPVKISEFLTANVSSLETRLRQTADDSFRGDAMRPDWIEIANQTDAVLDVSGFHLTDDPDEFDKWAIPEGTSLQPNGFLTVLATRRNITDTNLDEAGFLHTNFTLRVEGEYLALTSPDGFVLDEFADYPLQVPDVSYGRLNDADAYFHTATPNTANSDVYAGLLDKPAVDVERGFYSEAFFVAVSHDDAAAQIRYTVDGSTPSETNGILYSTPIEIKTTTNLRAIAVRDGFLPSRVETNTYLFLNDVINQGNNPEGYPDQFGLGPPDNPPWDARPADYEMDPEITQSEAYRDLMDDALLAIPSVSITTSIANLFDTNTGIYQNTDNHGVEWERPASIEMINPDGSTAFQIDAGIRIQGGASREPWKNPKHGFRLKFKGIYGSDDLNYDWFGGDSVDKFDEIVLRAGANQAWTHHNNFLGDNRGRAQYVRDQWVNDTYRAMGHPAPHNDYAHLYVNGLYWGLYNPKERPTSDYMASYFGGSEHDYDVLNAGSILDGERDGWLELTSRDFRNMEDDALYESFTQLIDIDSFIDYMIMNHYGGNLDWDSHNWYAAQHRGPDGKFMFIPWDGEFVFISPNDNKIRSREAAPGQILSRLQTNDEFIVRMADRIQKHLFHDGLLTPDKVVERWEARSSQITDAIIAESARWGDFRRDVDRERIAGPFVLLERDVHWMAERERLLTEYFPVRTDIVVEQYRDRDLFPAIDAPGFNLRGGSISSADAIELTSVTGQIYYTTDGSDPRLPGGEINPTARLYESAFSLTDPTLIRTRVLDDTVWSAVDEAFFSIDASPATSENLRVSELHYNPADPTDVELAAEFNDNDEFEFIELINISSGRIDLTDVQFVRTEFDGDNVGIAFDFEQNTFLEPNERLVVVENTDAFALRYGTDIRVAGQYSGKLSNRGEQITLMSGDQLIQQFTYSDSWHDTTDGDGFSLEVVSPASPDLDAWSTQDGWRPSAVSGGSPGGETVQQIGDVNHDGIFNSADLVAVFAAAEYEDDIEDNSTFEEGDWNGDGDFTSTDLVLAFQSNTYVNAVKPSSLFIDHDDSRIDGREPADDWKAQVDDLFAHDKWHHS